MLGALLAWEGGSGRGHIVTLKTVAEALDGRFTFDAALRDLTFKDELSALCKPVQGPWLPFSGDYRRACGDPPTSTWGELLGDSGFRRPDILRQSIGWWQDVMRECDISLLIADSAPCALLAARGLGIPSVAVGTGYLVPPPKMKTFPVLLQHHSIHIYDESETTGIVNSVLQEFGIPLIEHLPQVYACSDQLAFTLEFLDPYTEWRSEPLLPPIMGGGIQPAMGGDEVFVYFSSTEIPEPDLFHALMDLDVPVRAFVPGIDASTADTLSSRGIRIERSPVPPAMIAKRSRLIINAAQHGILCLGVAAGLPQVSMPQHREQQYNATAAERFGSLLSLGKDATDIESLRSTILNAYENASMARCARDLAESVRPSLQVNQRKMIRRRIAKVMDEEVSSAKPLTYQF